MEELGLPCQKEVSRCVQQRSCVRCQGCGPWVVHGPASLLKNCMLDVCRAAMLSVGFPLPKCFSESFGLVTDDICHFTSRGMEQKLEILAIESFKSGFAQPPDHTSYWFSE